ncbi:MAG: adenosylmethionine--8-amino-7-oxononanoate transaminase [Gammaproteobacteria bacterium]|nr:adenosylmethionine--8-amino-7-oxononanoate transaminase [Gammaproteobacteria bacterium]
MKDHETARLLTIVSAEGCYLKTDDGSLLFDAISSWWCKSLGHGHPRLKRALKKQLEQFEHVIFAGTTYDAIVELSEKMTRLLPNVNKVFFASDGSSAVEIALKMSLHAHQIAGQHQRTHFVALENAYHGETVGALSVSDLGLYKTPYKPLLFPTTFLQHIPYVRGSDDPLWHDCETEWVAIEKQLNNTPEQLSAIIVEPIVQGAGGIKIYSADFLRRLSAWAKTHGVHLIADEIMTGIARTGKMLACEHAAITPDFLCLSKGLTSGFLPMSAVLTTQKIYDYFYDDYETGRSFLHSHTFSGNALAAAVANETLSIVETESIEHHATFIGQHMRKAMYALADEFTQLSNPRGIGAIAAIDLPKDNRTPRLSLQIAVDAAKNGILLRPIDQTLYWMPPLIAETADLDRLYHATRKVLSNLRIA